MARQNMLRAVNREIRGMPEVAQDSATAELVRQLAREFDAGDRVAAGPLMRALDQLRKLAEPPKTAKATESAPAPEQPLEEAPDELDEVARMRADRLAGASGVVRALRADHRRSGGAVPG